MESESSVFLHELLDLFDSDDDPQPLPDLLVDSFAVDTATPAPRKAKATRSCVRKKCERDQLRVEAASLTQELECLRAVHGTALATAKQRAVTERAKRQRAEAECRQLRQALYTQRRFIGGLRSVFSAAPRFAVKLDLSRYLHLHTRLARHRTARWSDFDVEAHDARLQLARDVLCHETELMMPSAAVATTPFVSCEIHDNANNCYATTSTAVYAVDISDLEAVVRAACVAIREDTALCAAGHTLSVSRNVIDVEASPASNMLYRMLVVHHPCATTGNELVMQTHAITSYKIQEDYAIVVWDFVDVDELHPTSDTTNISRTVTGACLIRREWCNDNVERMVIRSVVTKKLWFLDESSQVRWCRMHPPAAVRGKEMMFRRIVLEQLAAEKAVYAQTVRH